jgi:outer membrane protein
MAGRRHHDPDYLAAQAQRDAGGESAVQARALKRPSVQFQGGYQYNVTETNARLPEDLEPVFTGSRSGGRASIAVQAVQPL